MQQTWQSSFTLVLSASFYKLTFPSQPDSSFVDESVVHDPDVV